jgi:catechol 2,3-dioxygenase-like lactoylglutathione lyase family enzyme
VSLLDSGGGAYVEIFDRPDRPDNGRSCLVHFALRSREVDALIDRVRAVGRTITLEPTSLTLETNVGPKPFTIRIAFFEGPDGESVELFDEQTPIT